MEPNTARIEPTEDTTVAVDIERANGEDVVLFLEPGNKVSIAEDGPVYVEARALTEEERQL